MTGISSSDRDAWLEARKDLLTASDVARALNEGYARNDKERAQQRAQLVMEKAGLAEAWEGDERSELAGLLEPAIIQIARDRYGWDIRPHGILEVDAHCPDLGATPDSVIHTPWGRAPVNVKVTACKPPEDCKPKKDGSPSEAAFANGIPLYYAIQLQSEMAVTGATFSGLLCLHHGSGLKLRAYWLARHERMVRRIRLEATRVMEEVRTLRAGRIAV